MSKRGTPGFVPQKAVADLSAVRGWRLAPIEQLYFRAWSQLVALTVRRERDRLRANVGKISLGKMTKDELVNQAETQLGMRREAAVSETAGQLRLMLKEAQDLIRRSEWDPPKGLADKSKATLQQACQERGLDFTGMTREPMIRMIKQWSAASAHYGISATEDMIRDYFSLESTREQIYAAPQLAPAQVAKASTSATRAPVNTVDPRRMCRPKSMARHSGSAESVSMATPRGEPAPVGEATSAQRWGDFVVVANEEPSSTSPEVAAAAAEQHYRSSMTFEMARMLFQGVPPEKILLDAAASPTGMPPNMELMLAEAKRIAEEHRNLNLG